MAPSNEKLAASLKVLRKLQEDVGSVIKSSELSRTHRERLQRTGFLTGVMAGWLVATRPEDRPGDSTFWYSSFWEFCLRYCNEKFGDEWCLSPEQSLLRHAESPAIPGQVIVWSPRASGNNRPLPFQTSIYDLKKALPAKDDLVRKDGFPVLAVEAALIKVTERFFQSHPLEARIVLASLRSTSGLLARLLDGGHARAAGRVAGALRNMDRAVEADRILRRMRSADHDVRIRDPFSPDVSLPHIQTGVSPLVGRIRNAWQGGREVVIDVLPEDLPLPHDADAYLANIDEVYVNDAYNSLSIEGYRVTEKLIERVRTGQFDPEGNPVDRTDRDALAARGYWQAFQAVRASIVRVLAGEPAGLVAVEDHDGWYEQLFQPSVDAGIVRAGVLAGFRNHPVYLRGSRHVPPRVEAVADGMEELFVRLTSETSAVVRAVLGHWLIGYVHPYSDGNGRMARFLMNVMLASGGHPWTIIRLEDRARYMLALEAASTAFDVRPFAELIAERLNWSMQELKNSN